MSPGHGAFTELPVEVITLILVHVDYRMLLICKEVCHFLRSIINNDQLLSYRIDLAAANMEDGMACQMNTAERYRRLRQYVSGWDNLKGLSESQNQRWLAPLPGNTWLSAWEVQAGILGRSYHAEDGTYGVVFDQLPAIARNIPHRQWHIGTVGHNLAVFTMEPSEDLLATVHHGTSETTSELRLRRLSDGGAHPSAALPVLNLDIFHTFHQDFTVKISGDFIGVSAGRWSEFILWNWKTSTIVGWVSGRLADGFILLDQRFILLSERSYPASLRVYDLNHLPRECACLDSLAVFCVFEYPESCPIYNFQIHTSSPLDWTPNRDLDPPFFSARDDRFIVVTFHFEEDIWARSRGERHPEDRTHFISYSVISSRLEHGIIWDWNSWGVEGTCMTLGLSGSLSWKKVKNGPRVAFWADDSSTGPVLTVYDFTRGQRRRPVVDEEQDGIQTCTQRFHRVNWMFPYQQPVDLWTDLQYTSRTVTLEGIEAALIGPSHIATYEDGIVIRVRQAYYDELGHIFGYDMHDKFLVLTL